MKGVPLFQPSASKPADKAALEVLQEVSRGSPVAATGVGAISTPHLGPLSSAVGAIEAAGEGGGAEMEREGGVQARIVGQGYKQVREVAQNTGIPGYWVA